MSSTNVNWSFRRAQFSTFDESLVNLATTFNRTVGTLNSDSFFHFTILTIHSPGGSVQAGLAIFDTMQYIPCDVNTVCFGMAASMGAFLLSAGTKGKRRSLPNSRIMIHQPSGGGQGEVRRTSPPLHQQMPSSRFILIYSQILY